jgi:hypothetical protein
MYRGREMVHRSLGYQQLDHVKELLSSVANVENPPRMEGLFLSMFLVPNREAIAELQRAEKLAAKAAEAERKAPTEVEAEKEVVPEAATEEKIAPEVEAVMEAEAEKKAPAEAEAAK